MMSLFSSFDLFFNSMYYMYFYFIIFSILAYSYKISSFNLSMSYLYCQLSLFFSSLKSKSMSDLSFSFIVSIMCFIFICNFSSVLPFNFAMTSQVSMVVLFSFSIWLSFFFFQLFKNMKGFLSHCVPEGTPIYLVWFLFLIELVSNMIRPLTLAVRLVANILAGHLLMILLSKLALAYTILVSVYSLLNLVELFVATIQSYIFVTMITLYYSDVN